MEKLIFNKPLLLVKKPVNEEWAANKALCDEVRDWLGVDPKTGKKVEFMGLMNLIKINGRQAVRECFIEAQKANFKNRQALFWKFVRANKTKLM